MLDPSDLSLIVLTWNKVELTEPLLESLLRHAPRGSEVVIVDNGSTDETPQAVARFARRWPRTRVLWLGENTGYSIANNRAAEAASGRGLVFLNNDMVALPGCFQPYLAHLDDERVGAVGVKLLYEDNRIQHAGVDLMCFGHSVHRHFGLLDGLDGESGVVPVCGITGACLGMRRDLYLELGGYDADYLLVYQDVDLGFKVLQRGLSAVYAPDARLYHLESVTTKTMKTPSLLATDWGLLKRRWHGLYGPLRAEFTRIVDQQRAGRPLVVYGTSRMAHDVAEGLGDAIPIEAFADSRPAAWGTTFAGRPVIGPHDLAKIPGAAVLIGSVFEREIREVMREAGVGAPVLETHLPVPLVARLLSEQEGVGR